MDNAADKRQIKRAERADAQRARGIKESIQHACETKPGRDWLWDQLVSAHIFQTTFDPNPSVSAFNEGQRNQGLILLGQIIDSAPEQFLAMMRENNAGSNRSNDSPAPASEQPGRAEPGRNDQVTGVNGRNPADHDPFIDDGNPDGDW